MAGHLLATQPPAMPEPAYQDEDEDDDAIPNFIEIDLVGGTQMTHTERAQLDAVHNDSKDLIVSHPSVCIRNEATLCE